MGRKAFRAVDTRLVGLCSIEPTSLEIGRPAFCYDFLCIFIMSLNFGRFELSVNMLRVLRYSFIREIILEMGAGSWVNNPGICLLGP